MKFRSLNGNKTSSKVRVSLFYAIFFNGWIFSPRKKNLFQRLIVFRFAAIYFTPNQMNVYNCFNSIWFNSIRFENWALIECKESLCECDWMLSDIIIVIEDMKGHSTQKANWIINYNEHCVNFNQWGHQTEKAERTHTQKINNNDYRWMNEEGKTLTII